WSSKSFFSKLFNVYGIPDSADIFWGRSITELIGPKYRVLTSSAIISMFSVGQVVMGTVAWLVQPWRHFNMILSIPCFIIIAYYWILSESIRWLLLRQKYEEAKKVLLNVARINKTKISDKSMVALMTPTTPSNLQMDRPNVVNAIIRSPVLLRRVCTTPICWITGTLIFYGLSINSTTLSDTMYLNYILTCAIEIPGFFFAVLVLDRIGRRATLSAGFLFSAACNLAFIFIPNDLTSLRLIVFLLGKFMISAVMNSLYLYTSELYPTEFRQSLLGFSSMVARIGSMVAPLTPVLANYWHGIPSMMFAIMGVISGLLVLTQPETLGTKLPDTIAEAEALGRTKLKEVESTYL
ncbi:solute carrier family 22 member 16-like, partial [Aricia agestis]|uniref:solute carrier family 22 member 16-like n=1 Tax=Aricia agestis TaxID=91739 RepID=UPI001C20774B